MGNISFSEGGWNDYLYWQTEDKKTLKRINQLLQDILRNSCVGTLSYRKWLGLSTFIFPYRLHKLLYTLILKIRQQN